MSAHAKAQKAPILLVEDEQAVMSFVRTALQRNGYAVECAESGARALEMLGARTYSGVVSDMRMPGDVDGADVFQWLRKNQPHLASRFLFITGDTVNEQTASALDRTGAPYVEKPFRITQLVAMVQQVIGDTK